MNAAEAMRLRTSRRAASVLRRIRLVGLLVLVSSLPSVAQADEPPGSAPSEKTGSAAPAPRLLLDRAVVRFSAPETGGARSPHFIFERALAFEARLEALADPTHAVNADQPYRRHHLQAALERHIAETLLASLRIDPNPTEEQVEAQMRAARVILTEQVGGAIALQEAARAEGVTSLELRNLLRRRARASLYLDRMVAPMLEPSDAELRKIHRSGQSPFRGHPFSEIAPKLRRWYVATALGRAALVYYQNARARLTIHFLPRRYADL